MATSEGEASGLEETPDEVAPEEQVDDNATPPSPEETPELIVATPAVPLQPITDHPNSPVIGDSPEMLNVGACEMNSATYMYHSRQDKPPFSSPRPFFGNDGMLARTVCTWIIGFAPIVTPFLSYSMFLPYEGGGYVIVPSPWPMVGNFGYAVPVYPTGMIMGTVELGVIWRFCADFGLMGYGINIATPIVATTPVMSHDHSMQPLAIRLPYFVMPGAPAAMWNAQTEVACLFVEPELGACAMPFANNSAGWHGGAFQGPHAQTWEAANHEFAPSGQMHLSEFHSQQDDQPYFQPKGNLNPTLMEQQSAESNPQTGYEIPQEENGLDMSRVIDVAMSLLRLQTSTNDPLLDCSTSSALVEDNFNYQQPNHESIDLVNMPHYGNEETGASRFGAIGEPIPGRSILEPGGPGYRQGTNEACRVNTSSNFLTHINKVLEDCEQGIQKENSNTNQIMAELSGVFDACSITLNYMAEGEAPNTSPPFPTGHDDPDFDQKWAQPPYFVPDPPHPEHPESLLTYEAPVPPLISLGHFMNRGGIELEQELHGQEEDPLLAEENPTNQEEKQQDQGKEEPEHGNKGEKEQAINEEKEISDESDEYMSLADTDSYLTMSTDSLNSVHIEVESLLDD